MASCVKSLGGVGCKKHSAPCLTEPMGNQRNPKPNVSREQHYNAGTNIKGRCDWRSGKTVTLELRDSGASFSFVIDLLCDLRQAPSHSGPVSPPIIRRKEDKMLSKHSSSISSDWGPRSPHVVPGQHLKPCLCASKAWEGVRGCLSAMFSCHLNSALLSDLSTLLWK